MQINALPQNPAQRIQILQADLEKAKAEKNRAEARMEELTKQRDQLLTEMSTLGVTPESIDTAIQEAEAERDRLLAEAEQLLRGAA